MVETSLMEEVAKTLHAAGLEKGQIKQVVLVGGSTRVTKVQKMLSDFFDNKVRYSCIYPY